MGTTTKVFGKIYIYGEHTGYKAGTQVSESQLSADNFESDDYFEYEISLEQVALLNKTAASRNGAEKAYYHLCAECVSGNLLPELEINAADLEARIASTSTVEMLLEEESCIEAIIEQCICGKVSTVEYVRDLIIVLWSDGMNDDLSVSWKV